MPKKADAIDEAGTAAAGSDPVSAFEAHMQALDALAHEPQRGQPPPVRTPALLRTRAPLTPPARRAPRQRSRTPRRRARTRAAAGGPLPGKTASGDALQRRGRQASASDPGLPRRRSAGRTTGSPGRAGLRRRADPRLLAGTRRSAG